MYEELTDFCGRDQIMQTPVRNLDFIVCAESSPWNIIREKECERIYIKKKNQSFYTAESRYGRRKLARKPSGRTRLNPGKSFDDSLW